MLLGFAAGVLPGVVAFDLLPEIFQLSSALALIGHSFVDGAGTGLAFPVSAAVGAAVAIAVIAHDFCDGLSTVGLMLLHPNAARRSLVMLTADALAPVLGAVSTLALTLPPSAFVLYLGGFAGFLLTVLGAAFSGTVVRLAG